MTLLSPARFIVVEQTPTKKDDDEVVYKAFLIIAFPRLCFSKA